eukprot:s1849_g3.t1
MTTFATSKIYTGIAGSSTKVSCLDKIRFNALFKYNRKNFMFDKKLKQEREFQEQDMRVAQFRLYREDVRDLVELTVGKMDLYLVSSALLIDRTAECADARPIDQDAIAAALQAASLAGHFPSVLDSGCKGSAGPGPLWRKPLGLLYDLDDSTLETVEREFGPGCRHTLAVKGTAVGPMLRRAVEKGFGLECASLGEALHAQAVGCPAQLIVFDSPCKTRSELAYALKQGRREGGV